jgi:hypothetical protein
MMIRCVDKAGNVLDIETIECTDEGARRLICALTSSGSTAPYSTVKLPRCGVKSVRVVTAKAARPKPAHVATSGACTGDEPQEPIK